MRKYTLYSTIVLVLLSAYRFIGLFSLNLGASQLIAAEVFHSDERASIALSHLKTASMQLPNNPEIHRLLGRAYLYDWNVTQAAKSMRVFGDLSPNNMWANLELNFVACAGMQQQNGNAILWRDVGITGNRFVKWLGQSASFAELANQTIALTRCQELSTPKIIRGTTVFEGGDLHGEIDDELVAVQACYGKQDVLVMYTGRTVRTSILLEETAYYRFTLQALNGFPPPILIDLTIDDHSIDTFDFDVGDESWTESSRDTFLEAGLHLVSLSFLNDGRVESDGKIFDRNAYISSLSVQRMD